MSSQTNMLDQKISKINASKEKLKLDDVSWYNLSVPQHETKLPKVYKAYSISKILTLTELKDRRLKKELEIRKKKEKQVRSYIDKASSFISAKKPTEAQQLINSAYTILETLKNPDLSKLHQKRLGELYTLQREIEAERQRKLEEQRILEAEKRRREEQKRREEEARRERERQERKRREREEQQRREREAQRLYQIQREKEEKERTEKERLESLSTIKKSNWEEFANVLRDNRIDYFYHFTDERNWASIKRHGGLYSWKYCEQHGIEIPCPGGNSLARDLDSRYKLQDYVRLSFCRDHPMAYRLEQSGSRIKLLKIKIDVAFFRDTRFSDLNATDSAHTHGENLEDLKRVNFKAVKRNHVRKDDPDFKPHQAEVMVKTFVPLKYIEEI